METSFTSPPSKLSSPPSSLTMQVDNEEAIDAKEIPQASSSNGTAPIENTLSSKGYQLGVTWTGLTVKGVSQDTNINENVLSQWNSYQQFKESRRPKELKTILENSHGCVKPGEMLLVLGRPGAGCTTLLNILSNRRDGYAEVEGDHVYFGSMDNKTARKYPGQIIMCAEDEIFFPSLTVQETMDFTTRMKLSKGTTEDTRIKSRDGILESMGIGHTLSSKVGNEFIRGVSGGERKRVSISEILATRGSIFCWDNSTRGLDASNALEFIRLLRARTDELGLSTIVTLYQAGNGIYNLFDKVLLLDQGKQIYYGPRTEALPFMHSMGFYCDPSANVADFLTGVTVPTERQILPGYEDRFPRTPDDILSAYSTSAIKLVAAKEYEYANSEEAQTKTAQFHERVQSEKFDSLPKNSPLTTGPLNQLNGNIIRQVQVLWGDKPTLFIKHATTLVQALITGSLFYAARDDSSGLFVKGGTIFLAVLYPCLIAMSETTDSFTARPVLAKHRMLAFHSPAAFCIAQTIIDIPTMLFSYTLFSLVVYFMVGLKVAADSFFIFWFMVFTTGMTMTAFFRLCGAAFPNFQAASKVSGFAVSAFATYVGYMIPKPTMHPWFVWIYWINPLSYGFESLMANEFYGQTIPCVEFNLAPVGPTYTNKLHQACTGIQGALLGATEIDGDVYLQSLSYRRSHMWRNFGIVWAWFFLYLGLTIFCTSKWQLSTNSSRALLIPRENLKKSQKKTISDEEYTTGTGTGSSSLRTKTDPHTLTATETEKELVRNTSVFTWKNLTYTIPTPQGERTLLDNVHGWVKPGQLGALMGSSGAGKTTLMDVLAQRKTSGTIHGSILVNGHPLSLSFQRSAGYCEQLDVHESMSTVREALEFAALLRQPRDTPKADKLKYVDIIVTLLELHDIEHTLIGHPGNGLSIEQRKRVTIGVELVSKPEILIFLDEPTSGLDGQAAFNTIRFLRKLAGVGQAILVTIHQPSALLFSQFDVLLLLKAGGKTVYFGDIGENSKTVREYFAKNGAPCPDDSNPAEHMIDVVSGQLSKGKDWHQVWVGSPEYQASINELDELIADSASQSSGNIGDDYEFAATLWEQTKILTHRMNVALYRDVEYVNNRIWLHIGSALFNGFTFWMIGNKVTDLQLRVFAIFNFIFVAPGVFAQLQPLFLERRDIYETREKKSKTYHWSAFVTALIVSEIPYLLVSGLLYWACFYYTVGFPKQSSRSGATLFVMLVYEFLYTGIGQFVAAYTPNATFAALVNPVIISTLVSFCGVLVPYAQIVSFWRYWIYYLNPFTYIISAITTFATFGVEVKCSEAEFAVFDPPSNQTCGDYLESYLQGLGSRTNLANPDATSGCKVCQYRLGSDYLVHLNIKDYYYGWQNAGISVLFVLSSYALVYLLMKLRTKATKRAES